MSTQWKSSLAPYPVSIREQMTEAEGVSKAVAGLAIIHSGTKLKRLGLEAIRAELATSERLVQRNERLVELMKEITQISESGSEVDRREINEYFAERFGAGDPPRHYLRQVEDDLQFARVRHEAIGELLRTTEVLIRAQQREAANAKKPRRRRPPELPVGIITDTTCSRCRKKPRRFNDLCKRCANELGVRPTGKV